VAFVGAEKFSEFYITLHYITSRWSYYSLHAHRCFRPGDMTGERKREGN